MTLKQRRSQRGQAFLEYALISAFIVVSFALASALGVSSFWTNTLDDARNKDYLVLNCPDFNQCVNNIGSINTRMEYR